MPDVVMSASFEDVDEADQVAVDVFMGMRQRVAHARLGRQMGDGVERLGFKERLDRGAIGPWVDLVRRKMQEMERGDSDINAYGLTNEAEFFAVATECFFEKPGQLLEKHPKLYAELQRFYKQDPAGWTKEPPAGTAEPATPTIGA